MLFSGHFSYFLSIFVLTCICGVRVHLLCIPLAEGLAQRAKGVSTSASEFHLRPMSGQSLKSGHYSGTLGWEWGGLRVSDWACFWVVQAVIPSLDVFLAIFPPWSGVWLLGSGILCVLWNFSALFLWVDHLSLFGSFGRLGVCWREVASLSIASFAGGHLMVGGSCCGYSVGKIFCVGLFAGWVWRSFTLAVLVLGILSARLFGCGFCLPSLVFLLLFACRVKCRESEISLYEPFKYFMWQWAWMNRLLSQMQIKCNITMDPSNVLSSVYGWFNGPLWNQLWPPISLLPIYWIVDPFNQICTPVVNIVDHGVIYSSPPVFCKEVTQGCEMQLVL